MRTISYLIGLLLLASAQGAARSQVQVECNYEGTQSQMTACAIRDFNNADVELNRIYKKQMLSLNPESRRTLREEQRNWLKVRDPKCKQEADAWAKGGSLWPILYNNCRQNLTDERIQQLRGWRK